MEELGVRVFWIENCGLLENMAFREAVAALEIGQTLEILIASNRRDRHVTVEDLADAVVAGKGWAVVVTYHEIMQTEMNSSHDGDGGSEESSDGDGVDVDEEYVRMVLTLTLKPRVVGKC